MKKIKVCHVVSVFPRHQYDTEVPWLRRCLAGMNRRGDCDVMVFAPSFRKLESHEVDGVPVKRFRYFFAPWEDLTGEEGAPNKIHKPHYLIITVFYILLGSIKLLLLHRRERFDILHIHWPFPHALFGWLVRLIYPVKIVYHFYVAELLIAKRFPFVATLLRYFIPRADAVIAISNFTAGKVRELAQPEITVIPYGTTIDPAADAPDAVAVSPAERIILAIGRQIERKGFEYAIRAMPLVRARIPDARLYLVGGGPCVDKLKQVIDDVDAGAFVTQTGKIPEEERNRLFRQCDLFVFPSIIDSKGDTEGLGVVALEAMTYRKPVVATDVGGITDCVVHEKTGLLVPQKDPAALAGAMIDILTDQGKARRFGDAGYDFLRSEFDWDVIIGKMAEVYGKVMKKGK